MMVADVWGQLGVCYQSIAQVDAAVEAYATAVRGLGKWGGRSWAACAVR